MFEKSSKQLFGFCHFLFCFLLELPNLMIKYLPIGLVVVLFFANANQWTKSNSSGAPISRTGAPLPGGGNELTCAGCHGGGINTGPVSLNIDLAGNPSAIVAGQTYTVTVSQTGGSAQQRGFQIVALDANLASTGTFTAGQGNKVVNGGGRQYVTHNNPNASSWTFTWTAPALINGGVTFYVASRTNGPNNTYTANKFLPADVTSVSASVDNGGLVLYPFRASEKVMVKSSVPNQALISYRMFDMSGKLIEQQNFANPLAQEIEIELPQEAKAGGYHVLIQTSQGNVLKRFIKE